MGCGGRGCYGPSGDVQVIAIGLMFASLLALAFAGTGLGPPVYPSTTGKLTPSTIEPAGSVTAIGVAVFLLILAGVVAKHRDRDPEDC